MHCYYSKKENNLKAQIKLLYQIMVMYTSNHPVELYVQSFMIYNYNATLKVVGVLSTLFFYYYSCL